ncbi:MAG: hypothetical protein IRY99_14915 [Isosphaeraceae bacterium]|nr:hypothetical protein [Isosphaeraceae bacterium]
MRPRATGLRRGITLTEILISILIMGIGLISLATLFPLGLLRLRAAQRNSRSALLLESAQGEMLSRNLLYKPFFLPKPDKPWYNFDPFIRDPDNFATGANTNGVDRNPATAPPGCITGGAGLPIAYDPLWWQVVNSQTGITPLTAPARFASGIGWIRPVGGTPSAYGLQRLTNFVLPSTMGAGSVFIDTSTIFASPDDIVYQTEGEPSRGPGFGSPVVPDLSTGQVMADLTFTWMFTGRQTDVTNGTVFDGDIVIFQNRPFAYEQVNSPFGGMVLQAAGETVVEAVFGYGTTITDPPGSTTGYSPNDTTVLLRWPTSVPDPEVKVGSWIADVTYERLFANENARFYSAYANRTTYYPAQRCYWYQVAKVTPVAADPGFNGDPGPYRRMIVTVATPVRAKTEMTGGSPTTPNAALVCPYVVNVFPKVFYVR